MKKFFTLILMLEFFVACGDNEKETYTWGDVSVEVATVFCETQNECGWLPDDRLDYCIDHSVSHLCELDDYCDVELDLEVKDFVQDCVDATSTFAAKDEEGNFKDDGYGCVIIGFFGQLAVECDPVWDYYPGNEEE